MDEYGQKEIAANRELGCTCEGKEMYGVPPVTTGRWDRYAWLDFARHLPSCTYVKFSRPSRTAY